MGYLGKDGRWRETVYMNPVLARQVADDVAEMKRASLKVCPKCGGLFRWDRDLGEHVWVATCRGCGERQA